SGCSRIRAWFMISLAVKRASIAPCIAQLITGVCRVGEWTSWCSSLPGCRRSAGALHPGRDSPHPRRSTRPGCEWLRAGSHRGGAPTTKPVNPSPPVGAPVPGAKGACPVRTEAVLLQKGGQPPSLDRSTRPRCEGCLAGSHRGGAPTTNPVNLFPGCEGCGADARRQNFLQQGLHVDARTSSGELIY